MQLAKFSLTSEESELLMLFEEFQDIAVISGKIGRDPSGVSNDLLSIGAVDRFTHWVMPVF